MDGEARKNGDVLLSEMVTTRLSTAPPPLFSSLKPNLVFAQLENLQT